MIKGCYNCAIKHLGYAEAAAVEVVMGYPHHERKVAGGLAHAAEEVLEFSYDLAMVIREHRLNWTEDYNYRIPYDAITSLLQTARAMGTVCIPLNHIPIECLEGLDINDDGVPVYSQDTRPG